MTKNDSWAVPIIIFLLIMIAGKLHVFDGLFSATSMVTGLAVGLFVIYGKQAVAICAIVIAVVVAWLMLARIFRGFGDVWNRIPERARFLGIVLLNTRHSCWRG